MVFHYTIFQYSGLLALNTGVLDQHTSVLCHSDVITSIMQWMIMEWYFITTVMIDSNVAPNCNPSGVISKYVNPYIPTQEVTYANTRLTALFMCGLVSDLVICKFRKSMDIHDTECPH